ncbi:MAG: ferredoxin-NAD reductase, partial [Gammaproteobacteria bacterium]|nr:ferredoxin-NAD reductase [Gammaproteobacteria bacterium]
TVLNGRVDLGAYQPAALNEAMRARGLALMCCATALEDVEIEIEGVTLSRTGGAAPPALRHHATVVEIDRLAPEVLRMVLALDGGERLPFAAGQYINIVLEDGATRSYSFANAPGVDDSRIELHLRRMPDGRFTTYAFERMQIGDRLAFQGPFGRFTLVEGTRPLLLVAGATGFAPIKSIVEDAFRRGVQRPMYLYWGVRTREDLYMADLAEHWQATYPDFHFVPVLSAVADDDPWPGRRGLVHEAILADFGDMRGYEVYACGSVSMIETAVPAFLAHGLDENFCYSDAFVPASQASS